MPSKVVVLFLVMLVMSTGCTTFGRMHVPNRGVAEGYDGYPLQSRSEKRIPQISSDNGQAKEGHVPYPSEGNDQEGDTSPVKKTHGEEGYRGRSDDYDAVEKGGFIGLGFANYRDGGGQLSLTVELPLNAKLGALSSKVVLGISGHETPENGIFGGFLLGARFNLDTQIAPFVGVNLFAGDDEICNEDGKECRIQYELAAFPELGLHYYAGGVRLSAYRAWRYTTRVEQNSESRPSWGGQIGFYW